MASDGKSGLDREFSLVYEELRRLARSVKGGDGSALLNPTALVHEAYVQLSKSGKFSPQSASHLKYTVVGAMRHLLVDAARHRTARKRGGGIPAANLDLAGDVVSSSVDPELVILMNFALEKLAATDALKAKVFECHFFGGLTRGEIAEVVGVSEKKVSSCLLLAKAWLSRELGAGGNPSE